VSAGIPPGPRTGGELLVACLRAQGVDRAFCVPGESYLPVLDALVDSDIDVVAARHEGGAAMMAEADGKLTGRPGVAFVTRGPGATNAASGVHVARQDSTPLVLFVGQIGRGMRGRDAFQEVDYRQTFGDLAKWVDEIDRVERIPEVLARAWHVAMNGRPGPVVLALPEDVLKGTAAVAPGPRVEAIAPAPTAEQLAALAAGLGHAERPLMILGGSRWTGDAVDRARAFAETSGIPVAVSFRRQQLFDHDHPLYAGDVGLGINPALAERIARADLLLLVGGRFSESPSQGYTLLDVPRPRQVLVHVHPGSEELGRVYHAQLAIQATPETFFRALGDVAVPTRRDDGAAHRAYEAWSAIPDEPAGARGVDPATVIATLRDRLPDDAILTNGAGNYAIWLHRFFRFRGFRTQLAPTSGSMGYGLPAAVAAALRHRDRPVVCLAGDGCLQMTVQELGTAAQHGAALLVLVLDNGMYGTIRMHQERHYPGRVSATDLVNPDFATLAAAYGLHAETVASTDAFAPALDRALAAVATAGRPALLHLRTDPQVLSPTTTLAALRGA
jgi:acetolactate synthase-1/2/3 large subunit